MNSGEEQFKVWLDEKRYSYLCIDQDPQTFPEFFRGLSKRPDFLAEIAAACGIPVVPGIFSPGIRGMLAHDEAAGVWVVLLREGLDPAEEAFTITHELGHYFLHRGVPGRGPEGSRKRTTSLGN